MPKVVNKAKKYRHDGLQKQGITFNKDLGQHILKNPLVIDNMIEKVNILC